MVGPLLERLGLDSRRDLLGPRRRVPRPRAEPAAAREPPVHHRPGARPRAPTSGSPGTATPTAASSSTTTASSSTATSSPRCSRGSVLGQAAGRRRILYDVRASRAVPDTVAAAGGTSYVNRVGHAFFKQAMREHDAAFGGEVSGHYYFRDFWCADSGTCRRCSCSSCSRSRAGRCRSSSARSGERYFISGEINSEVADQEGKMKEIAERLRGRRGQLARRRLGRLPRLALQRAARRTPSRCCASTSSRSSRARTWSKARRGARPDPFVTPEEALAAAARGRDPGGCGSRPRSPSGASTAT